MIMYSDLLRTRYLIPNQWSVQFHQYKKKWNLVRNGEMKNDWQLWQKELGGVESGTTKQIHMAGIWI